MPDRLSFSGRLGWLPATGLVLGCLYLILEAGVPHDALFAYSVYVVLCIVLPGFLVHRSLRGPQESWGADLALGAATGTALELIAWAAAVGTGHGDLLRWWPLLTLPLLLHRTSRRHILDRGGSRPLLVSVTTCGSALLAAVFLQRSFLLVNPLPPSTQAVYPDVLWHLGLAGEATRSFPLGTPQLLDDGDLKYHWFANAHMAAGSLITGVDVTTVGLRLWFLPSIVLAVALTAALGHRVAGRSSAAAMAAILVAPVATLPWFPWAGWTANFWSALSPSQLYAHTPILLAAHSLVDVVRGRATRGTWGIVALAILACTGAKASALPILVGGVGLAWLASLVLREGRVRLTALSVGLVVATALAARLVQGGSTGSTFQLFSNLTLSPVYRARVDRTPTLDTLVPPGLFDDGRAGLMLLALLLAFEAIRMIRLFAWIFVPTMERLRTDLAAWFLSGVSIASLLALIVISHAGYSQYYFPFGAMPLGAVLCAWTVSELVAKARPGWVALAAAATVGAAVNAFFSYRAFHAPPRPSGIFHDARNGSFKGVAILALVLLAVAVVVGIALALSKRELRQRAFALAGVAFVGAIAVSGFTQSLATHPTVPTNPTVASTSGEQRLLDQGRAAEWIRRNVPKEAVVATNIQCLGREDIACPSARSWWISGLGQRRVLLEGWDYIPSTGGQAFDDPALFALNAKAFTDPSSRTIDPLKKLGVTWLVSEKGIPGATVSPALDVISPPVHVEGSISIHRLG